MPARLQDWDVTTADGVRLVGDDQGPPNGPPIVALHGLSSNLRWWDPVAARLALRYRVVRYDQRGHGRSTDGPIGGHTVDRLASDAVRVLDHLGLGRVMLVGHSAGADIAAAAAAIHPDRVVALALVEGGVYDPRLLFGDTWQVAWPRMSSDRRAPTTEAVLAAYLAGATSSLPREALPALLGNYTRDEHRHLWPRLPHQACEQLAHSLWRRDPIQSLAAVAVPVLVIAAQADTAADQPRRESIRRARARLGDRLRVVWLPGGHELPLEQPAAVAEALAGLAAAVGCRT
jgi:pimeloyl-ACP methyl ester carboxylesterase